MASKDFHVVAETGIHARPEHCWYKLLANLLQISLLSTKVNQLTLNQSGCYESGVGQGADVTISAEGADADDAIAAISETMEKEGLA